jgi:hypothetical protein
MISITRCFQPPIRYVRMCFIVWRGQTGCRMKRLYLSGAKVLATKTAFAQSTC